MKGVLKKKNAAIEQRMLNIIAGIGKNSPDFEMVSGDFLAALVISKLNLLFFVGVGEERRLFFFCGVCDERGEHEER